MAILPIIIAPDPRLKRVSRPVDRVDDDIRRLMDDLLETMYEAPGIGLAAPQAGILKRVVVVDASEKDEPSRPLFMANPTIVETSSETAVYEEGCLSLPEQFSDVTRPARATFRYLDREDEPRELVAEGLLATCIQHEIDHLDGVLFVDHISALKRNIILRKLTKAKKQRTLVSA